MEKIEVKVCMGTTCFIMGSAQLMELTENLPTKYQDKVNITTDPCLGLCSINWEYSKAPYVKVGDEIISEATVDKILQTVERKIQNEHG